MPEGPTIVILKEAVHSFVGRKVIAASGNSKKVDFKKLTGLKIIKFKSWGKHFLICFPKFTIRIHFLMFGSYRINESKEKTSPRLSLRFSKGEVLNFYTCSIITIDQPLDDVYDWTADVMSKSWDSLNALKKLAALPETLVCDALLDQKIFAGVGNIIKNEVLFRIQVHPKSIVQKLPQVKRRQLVREAVLYSFEFLKWKKEFTLKKHWFVYTKKVCPRDSQPIHRKHLGTTNRRTFFCNTCQTCYV